MSAPEPIDEFDRLLANEDSLEKYVSLGLALEELLEKLRAKRALKQKKRRSRVYLSFHGPERSSLSLRQSGFSIVRSDRMSRHSCAIRTILFNRFGLS